MTNKHLHIISFDVPFPADYGGAIDVFYRMKALHKLGVKITLHCFEYGRGEQDELLKYAETVHYYPRKKTIKDSLSRTPFIVKSRNHISLIYNLTLDDSPILFEGLHSCYFLNDSLLRDRLKIVRTHNIEHHYYKELSKHNKGLTKRFYSAEARKLKRFEKNLRHANHILAIKDSDATHFKKYSKSVQVLLASSDEIKITAQQETKPYFLFHGNLSVEENENGAKWLIENVISPLNLENTFKIAGKNPSEELVALCSTNQIDLISDPSSEEMNDLIQSARVHVFHTDQATGVKLKLVNAMASSGHVIVNENMIQGTNLGGQCSLASDQNEFQLLVKNFIETELSAGKFQSRISFLKDNFSTEKNCKIILDLL